MASTYIDGQCHTATRCAIVFPDIVFPDIVFPDIVFPDTALARQLRLR
jgi:hypothetical protein